MKQAPTDIAAGFPAFAVLDDIKDGVLVLDRAWKFVYLNHEAARALGRGRTELIGKELWTEFPDFAATSFARAYRRAMTENRSIEVEDYYPPARSWFAARVHATPSGLAVFFEGLHNHKTLALERSRQQVFMRQIIDLVPHFIFAKDRQGRFTLVNRAVAQAYGTTVENLLGKTDADFNPNQAEVEHFLKDDREVMDSGTEKIIWAEKITDAEGRLRWLQTIKRAIVPETGGPRQVLGVSTDITRYMESEKALRDARERLEAALAAGDIGTWVWDVAANTLLADAHLARLFSIDPGKAAAGLPLETYVNAIQEEDRTRVMAEIMQSVKTGADYDAEYRVKGSDGRVRWVQARGHLERDAEGRPSRFPGAVMDITARKAAEEEIRGLNAHLEEKVAQRTADLSASNKELESFSYSISHDLRTPLRSIDGFSLALLEDAQDKLNAAERENLGRIRKAAQRMGHLIDSLLNLSRLTRLEMRRDRVELSAQAAEILEEFKRRDPGRRVETHVAPGVTAQGDPDLLRVVLQNLLENAWKFTGRRDDARISFGVETADGARAYFVRDNGVGFDMAYADKIWGAFERLHGADQFPGTGIGLTTVQKIIQRHGGRAWARGAPGQGATFYFTL